MKLDGIGNKIAGAGMMRAQGSEAGAVLRQIRMLQRDLNQLEQKKELTKEEAQKKQELEKQIAELKQQLQQIKVDERKEKLKDSKTEKTDEQEEGRLGEEGKSGNVDEFI